MKIFFGTFFLCIYLFFLYCFFKLYSFTIPTQTQSEKYNITMQYEIVKYRAEKQKHNN